MDRNRAKAELMAGWNGMILGGLMTYDELTDSLLDQVTGSIDMSADELTDELAGLMGWNPSDITESQYRIWKDIVNETAREYLGQPEIMTIDAVKGMLMARGWNTAGIEPILDDVEDMKEEDRTRANIIRLIEDYEDR